MEELAGAGRAVLAVASDALQPDVHAFGVVTSRCPAQVQIRGLARYRNSSEVKAVRFRRHTIQVWAPGVSMSTCRTPLDASHARSLRFRSISRSSVPQAIHSKRSCWSARESRAGKSFSKSSGRPPELKAPIQAN